jgi:hypothetical protein
MIAILSGIGGSLSCLALHTAARGIASLRRSRTVVFRGPPPPRPPTPEGPSKKNTPATQLGPPSQPTPSIPQSTQHEIYWQERNDRLVGTYQTTNGSYAGYITNSRSARRQFFIVYPPQALRDGSQDTELVHRGNGRYLIRLCTRPTCAGDGIRAIERMLAEADRSHQPVPNHGAQTIKSERIVVAPVKRERIVVSPVQRNRVVVKPKYRPYWQTQDWVVVGDTLVGQYKTPLGSTAGYIENYKSREPLFYVVNPPTQLKRHPHRHCFQSRESRDKGHYWVHFGTKPRNPDSGILEIEKILMEALQLPRR